MTTVLFLDLQSPYVNVKEDHSGDVPSEFRLFQYGVNKAYKMGEGDKEIMFDQADASRLVAAYGEAGVDLVIDFEHQSLDGMTGPKAAAGWIKHLEMRDDGLYATGVEWTPRAMQMLKDKEYRYFSPAVEYNDEGEMCRMLPAALTNLPALKGIQALMNSIIASNNDAHKDNNMSEKQNEVEALSATETLSQLKAMKEEVEKLRKEKFDMEVNSILDKAVSEGRLAPAKRQELHSQVETLGLAGLKLVVSNLPQIVKASATAPKGEDVQKTEELTAFEKSLARQIGVSQAAFAAQKRITAERLGVAKNISGDVQYQKNEYLAQTLTMSDRAIEKMRETTVVKYAASKFNMLPDTANVIKKD